ncbi:MAG: adenosylcobinamide-phosphate synthase CbiB [Eubacterium sp.]|nr:adenosylcobinamide-phosphate synthase CbiB [Eubacterium sp.]
MLECVLPVIPLILGFIIDFFLGDPYSLPHPIRLIGTMIMKLEKKLRKPDSDHDSLCGTILAVIVLAASTIAPLGILFISYSISKWLGIAVESILCYYLIAAKCLKNESMKVFHAISAKDTEKARHAVSMIVGRDTACLDESGIIKAAVETVAENTSDGVTAPIFYMTFFGAIGGFFYKSANTMDSMIGYKNEKYLNFGRFAARLDDILNFIPSRLTAVFMILSAYILRFNGRGAYKIWRRDRFNHASPNSAQTESVCAGALDVMLAGDAYYFGKLCKKKTIGDDIRPIKNEDICRANSLMYCTAVLMLILSAVVRAIIFGVIL